MFGKENSLIVKTRQLFANNEIYKRFLLNSLAQGYLEKMNNLLKHQGAGTLEARSPMQLHRLHRPKAGPASTARINAQLDRRLPQVKLQICAI